MVVGEEVVRFSEVGKAGGKDPVEDLAQGIE